MVDDGADEVVELDRGSFVVLGRSSDGVGDLVARVVTEQVGRSPVAARPCQPGVERLAGAARTHRACAANQFGKGEGAGERRRVGDGDLADVLPLHPDDQVGVVHEVTGQSPAPVRADVDAAPSHRVDAVAGCLLAVRDQAGRLDDGSDTGPSEVVTEQPFGHGRPTDVAGTQHEQMDRGSGRRRVDDGGL